MKNRTITSFLHQYHSIFVIAFLSIMLLQHGDLLAQSKKDKLPTIKVSKKRKESLEVKAPKKAKKKRDTYTAPRSASNSSKSKNKYSKPRSLSRKDKHKDAYQRPASKTVNFNNSPKNFKENEPPYEEGQSETGGGIWKKAFRKKSASTFEGKLKRTKGNEGTKGTDYRGKIRTAPQKLVEKQFQHKAEYVNLYSGGKRVPTRKRSEKINQKKSEYIQTSGLYKVKKKNNKAASYTSYQGQLKLPTLKAKTRHSKKLSEKVHQFDGDIRYRKPGKDMHPSVFHLKAKTKKSYEQKEKYRRWRIKLSHIFKKSDQPKHLDEKDHKPRYDKDESEIWYY